MIKHAPPESRNKKVISKDKEWTTRSFELDCLLDYRIYVNAWSKEKMRDEINKCQMHACKHWRNVFLSACVFGADPVWLGPYGSQR